MTVEDKVRSVLANNNQFIREKRPFFRYSNMNTENYLVAVDGNYLSIRWPWDENKFAQTFLVKLNEYTKKEEAVIH